MLTGVCARDLTIFVDNICWLRLAQVSYPNIILSTLYELNLYLSLFEMARYQLHCQ